jgi:hypothetical protein
MISNKTIQNHSQFSSHAKIIALTIGALSVSACSHGEKERLSSEVEKQPVTTRSELRANTESLIENMPNIEDAQRTKLIAIRNEAGEKVSSLQVESLKIRSLIVSEITNPTYDAKKVETLKSRLKDVENERIKTTFKAIDDANVVLGRNTAAENRRRVFEEMFGAGPHGGTNVD